MTIDSDTALDTLRLPSYNNGILLSNNFTTRPVQFYTEVIDTIRLFIMQTLDIIENAFSFSKTGCRYQHGNTINRCIAVHFNTSQPAPSTQPQLLALDKQVSAHGTQRPDQFFANLFVW